MRFFPQPNPGARPGPGRNTSTPRHRVDFPAPIHTCARGGRGPFALRLHPGRMNSIVPPKPAGSAERQRRRQARLAGLIQNSKCVRIAVHLAGIVRKPRNLRWHWHCITREFHDRTSGE